MSLHLKQAGRLSAREICTLALTGALMFATKLALAVLPNVHMNALFIILGGIFFGWRMLYAVAVYIMLEGLFFGFGLWWISYWYAWPLFLCAVMAMRGNRQTLIWAAAAGGFGLCFGLLCAIPYLFIGGAELALSSWVAGIPFDLAHCAGNFVITLALYKPLYALMEKILNRA